MPKWPNISDEDLNNVIAYLKSDQPKVQPSDIQHPVAKRSLLGKFLSRVAFKPYPYTEKAIARPDTTNLLALGEYLVNDYLLCFDCHSAAFETNSAMNPNSSLGYLGGGIIMETKDGQPITTPNITRSENGIGHYSYDDFENAVKWGKSPDNPTLSYPMIKFTALSDKEVQAMWEYLQTVDPL
jgi:cytochrome c1